MQNKLFTFLPLALLSVLNLQPSTLLAQGTAFTYQGRLADGGSPANGNYDLRLILFPSDVGGIQVGPILTNAPTLVNNGLFTATLDFGNVFAGADRWLEIAVRTNGGGAFTPLTPRQRLTPAPYAIMANSASNLLGNLPAGQLEGILPLATLPASVVTNNGSGLTLAGSFSGNGAGLTNLPFTALSAGGQLAVTNTAKAMNVTLTNVFRVEDYGAVGDGITVEDNAFSNCWKAFIANGGIFDFSGRGRSYVISNFVFDSKGLGVPNGLNGITTHNQREIRGYGAGILHVGTNFVIRFTNTCCDMKGLTFRGNANAAGAVFIKGAPSNFRMEDCTFHGYSSGYGVLAEGLAFWSFRHNYAEYCRRGFAFGSYCDGMDLDVEVTRCAVGVECGAASEMFQYLFNSGSQEPIGGNWRVQGNYNGDMIVFAGRKVILQAFGESATNSFVTIGHSARHGTPNGYLGCGGCRISGVFGFGNLYGTNYAIENNLQCVDLTLNVDLYAGQGNGQPTNLLGLVKNSNAAADNGWMLKITGSGRQDPLPSVYELSTGTKFRGQFPGGPLQEITYNNAKRSLLDNASFPSTTGAPAYEFSSVSAANTPEVFRAGYYSDRRFTDFASGVRIFFSSSPQLEVSNITAHFRSPTFIHSTLDIGSSITATNGYFMPTNALSSWPTAARSRGEAFWGNSNGWVYLLTSDGTAGTAWTKTNLIASPKP